jgi:hypothetical protein
VGGEVLHLFRLKSTKDDSVFVAYIRSTNIDVVVMGKRYTMDEIESYIRQSYAEEEEKTSKEYQRQLLTPSLRYDIMKRDGFRCVLCGRTSKDGIALHVDHILPVSKGGQTIPSNLRTLCDVCNLGKSDKYDNDGLNRNP